MGKSDIQSIDQTQAIFNNYFCRIFFKADTHHTIKYYTHMQLYMYEIQYIIRAICMLVCTEWLVAVQGSDMIKRVENTKFGRVSLKQL